MSVSGCLIDLSFSSVNLHLGWGGFHPELADRLTSVAPSGWSTLQAIFIFSLLPIGLVSLAFWWFYYRRPKIKARQSDASPGQNMPTTGLTDTSSPQQKLAKELQLSETRYQTLVDTVIDGIVTIDTLGIVLTFNPAAERMFGYRPDEVIGKNVKMLMPDPYAAEHDGYVQRYLDTSDPHIIGIGREVRGLRKDGSTFPIHLGISEMFIGEERRFVGLIRDITVLRRALKEQEHLASIVEGTNDAIIGKDLEGTITSWNTSAEEMYGYRASDMIGRSILSITPAARENEITDILKKLHNGEPINYFETQRLRKDGKVIEVALTFSPIRDEMGSVIGASTIARDITARKTAEKKLEIKPSPPAASASSA